MDKINNFLFSIYWLDKTPPYYYGKGKRSQTKEGKAPGPGKRFLTPREKIRYYFDDDFWPKYKKWLKKAKKMKK